MSLISERTAARLLEQHGLSLSASQHLTGAVAFGEGLSIALPVSGFLIAAAGCGGTEAARSS